MIFFNSHTSPIHIPNNKMSIHIILMATGTPSPKLKAKAIPARPSKGLIDDHSKDSEEGD